MEKTILISGVPVQFKCTGAFLLHFKRLTGKDPIKEIVKLETIFSKKDKKNQKVKFEDISIDDLEMLYEIAWVLAKTANNDILDMLDWIDSFDEFPIGDIISELVELLQKAFTTQIPSNSKKK